MIDVLDYLRRLFVAIFVVPAAFAFWVLFATSTFSLPQLILLAKTIGENYITLSAPEQNLLVVQIVFGWLTLAFLCVLMSFTFNPPKFAYRLKRNKQHYETAIEE